MDALGNKSDNKNGTIIGIKNQNNRMHLFLSVKLRMLKCLFFNAPISDIEAKIIVIDKIHSIEAHPKTVNKFKFMLLKAILD